MKLIEGGELQRAALADRPRQPPHAAQHLGRLPRHDRLAEHRRAAPRASWSTATTSRRSSTARRAADRLLRAAPARRDRRAARRRVPRRDAGRGRRRHRRPVRGAGRRSSIRGDEVIADFTGSSPQVRGPMNCTFVVGRLGGLQRRLLRHRSATRLIPRNSGCYRPDQHHRPGRARVVNVVHPGPVRRRQHRPAAEADRPAARRASPRPCPSASRRPAAARAAISSSAASTRRPARYYTNYHFDGMGAGGDDAQGRQRRRDHAPLQLPQHAGRGLRAPLSAPDARYGLAQDSGGAGRAPRRARRPSARCAVTAPEITFSALFDRSQDAADRASSAASTGGGSALLVKRAGDDRVPARSTRSSASPRRRSSPTSSCTRATSSATARRAAAASADRPSAIPTRVREDVLEGYVSPPRRRARLRRHARDGGACQMTGRWVELERAWHDDERRLLRRLRPADPAPRLGLRRRRGRAPGLQPGLRGAL